MARYNDQAAADRIWRHPRYRELYEKLQEQESERIFCGHALDHFLAVARLMQIRNLEENAGLPPDEIYAAALLHDLGRAVGKERGLPHHLAALEDAEIIMKDAGFTKEECTSVLEAIASHRDAGIAEEKSLRGFLYKADKSSRLCMICPAAAECSWPEEKRNLVICR